MIIIKNNNKNNNIKIIYKKLQNSTKYTTKH